MRNPGILFQNAHRSVTRHAVCRKAADVMVRAGAFEKAPDELRLVVLCLGGLCSARLERLFEVLPVRLAVLACERVLYIAQDRGMRGVRIRALETLARFRTAFTQRLEPALGFFP